MIVFSLSLSLSVKDVLLLQHVCGLLLLHLTTHTCVARSYSSGKCALLQIGLVCLVKPVAEALRQCFLQKYNFSMRTQPLPFNLPLNDSWRNQAYRNRLLVF